MVRFKPGTGDYIGQTPVDDDSLLYNIPGEHQKPISALKIAEAALAVTLADKERVAERLRIARQTGDYQAGTLAEVLTLGKPDDPVMLPHGEFGTTVKALKEILLKSEKLTAVQFVALPKPQQDKILRRMSRVISKAMREQHPEYRDAGGPGWATIKLSNNAKHVEARNELHAKLRQWALGELKLERPQGGSLHHLIQYDLEVTEGKWGKSVMHSPDVQSFVVEHDWARATAGTGLLEVTGEWQLPFAQACWEFRISGVRVLAFTHSEDGRSCLWCAYGRDGHWVADDYIYDITDGSLGRGQLIDDKVDGPCQFSRVTKLVFDNVRVACILMDAQLAEHQHVPASVALNKARVRQGKVPLRSHFVVRLLRTQHRPLVARSAGAGGGDRAPQRGHWRRATWVHYDDQDSGREQYVNDGGFWVSKTRRPWHFAGDPNNLITKEYRL